MASLAASRSPGCHPFFALGLTQVAQRVDRAFIERERPLAGGRLSAGTHSLRSREPLSYGRASCRDV
jgi:hypothetical protein